MHLWIHVHVCLYLLGVGQIFAHPGLDGLLQHKETLEMELKIVKGQIRVQKKAKKKVKGLVDRYKITDSQVGKFVKRQDVDWTEVQRLVEEDLQNGP